MRRSILAAAACGAAALSFGIAIPAAHAAIVERTENYACTYEDPGSSPDQWRDCDGTWYHAQHETYGRTIRVVAEVSYNANSGWRTTSVLYAQSLFPSLPKTIHWYCRYANNTTSALKGSTVLGGGLAASYTWSKPFEPCDGYSIGLIAQVVGGDNRCGEETFTTTIDLNSNLAGAGRQRGVEQTCSNQF